MDWQTRNTYLTDIPLNEAIKRFHDAIDQAGKLQPLETEIISVNSAHGRITSEPIWAKRSAPHYHASAMDGYAVLASDTVDATETRPVQLTLGAQAVAVNTGAPLPTQANAVIMVEHVQQPDEDTIEITAPVAPWQHVRMMGEDMVATELVLPSDHKLRPVDLGAIAGCGHHEVCVRRKPRVVLIPTGDELISVEEEPASGQIIEYNSLVLAAQIEAAGGIPTITPITPDNPEALQKQLQAALQEKPDLVLVLSGSSAGSKDFTASVIASAGELLVHGIAVRPGHPVIMGMADDTPIIGVPGYPVSAALTGEILVEPLIRIWQGQMPDKEKLTLQATLTRKLTSHTGDDDYVRVTVARVGDRFLATPISKGAGVITSLVRADGLAHVPRFSEGVDMGAPVTVSLYRSPSEIERAIMAIGSHDPMLDLLNQHLIQQHATRLNSANVGSLGGLVALRRNEAHLAGIHLLDEETGEYNIAYLKIHLRGRALRLVTFAHREQGLIVQPRNPLGITGIQDLVRSRFINRQRGAGTRLLLDYQLTQAGINPNEIEGYEREEYTHLAVAAAVATGTADCGMGVRSAAIALNLDFVPIGWERFDLAIPNEHMILDTVSALVDTLQSDSFIANLARQPGYRTDETGQLQYEQTDDSKSES
jgi:putative molybdopterin biosynthesis protein